MDRIDSWGFVVLAPTPSTASAHPEHVAACGRFHGGGLVTGAADSPHLGLGRVRAELAFGHADQDGSTMADTALWDEAAAERHYVELDGLFARTL